MKTCIDQRTRQQTTSVDSSLYLTESDEDHPTLCRPHYSIYTGRLLTMDEAKPSMWSCAVLVMDIADHFQRGWDVAMVGMGLMVVPRLMRFFPTGKRDVYEIDQIIIDKNTNEFPWKNVTSDWSVTQGDWKDTIEGTYDVLVYDATVAAIDMRKLWRHVKPGGLLYVYREDNLYHRETKG